MGATNATEWAFFFNRTCHHGAEEEAQKARNLTLAKFSAVSPAEEFYEFALHYNGKVRFSNRNYVLEKTATMDELGGLNLKVVTALAVAWILTALVLVKGVKMMGK